MKEYDIEVKHHRFIGWVAIVIEKQIAPNQEKKEKYITSIKNDIQDAIQEIINVLKKIDLPNSKVTFRSKQFFNLDNLSEYLYKCFVKDVEIEIKPED